MDKTNHHVAKACELIGSQAGLARELGVSPSMVNQWIKGKRPVPIEYCRGIEDASKGMVTRLNLCPDNWQRIWPELAKRKSVPAI
jgi:DNA-binding transcriptional regulator YdaS (Cro superfamily)